MFWVFYLSCCLLTVATGVISMRRINKYYGLTEITLGCLLPIFTIAYVYTCKGAILAVIPMSDTIDNPVLSSLEAFALVLLGLTLCSWYIISYQALTDEEKEQIAKYPPYPPMF
jgi:hypothetical protein